MIIFTRIFTIIFTAASSFMAGTYLDFSSYVVWMYEDPAWGPQAVSQPLQGDMDDYFRTNWFLHKTVTDLVQEMTAEQKAGELLMPTWESNQTIDEFIAMAQQYHIGGMMVLRDDVTPGQITVLKQALGQAVGDVDLPYWVAIDAEPSLLQYRIPSASYNIKTAELDTIEQSKQAAETIAQILKNYGYNWNFAPVYDSNLNKTVIGTRSYGGSFQEIVPLANAFTQVIQQQGIIATAKHFPGHGYARGDTHLSMEAIPGDVPELSTFESAMDGRVLSVMVGHLVVDGGEYDTAGLPATISATTTRLLRDDLRFQGIVITDALTMGALDQFDNVDQLALTGNDILLMPRDLPATYQYIVDGISNDREFEKMINEKVYRIIRMKLVQHWHH